MTIKEILSRGVILLKSNNIENPVIKARLLLQHTLGKSREYLIIYDNKEINKKEETIYFNKIKKIIDGIPLQHITQTQEFMKMNFFINDKVLIPRPDTEILVEEVIKLSKKFIKPQILDLCTGSGAIAVSLAKYIKTAEIYASDISKEALNVAKINAQKNEVEEKITFIESDLFNNIPKNKFDIIVSNPPYIRKDDIKQLDEDVKKEPIIALNGGIDGLDFYRKISKEAYDFLKYNSYLCFEIGYDQKIDVIEILENEKKYTNIYSKKDLYDNDRIIIAKLED